VLNAINNSVVEISLEGVAMSVTSATASVAKDTTKNLSVSSEVVKVAKVCLYVMDVYTILHT
jgi:hypothetical protein